ncbi:hypothetical protein QBC42DRAFT_258280 [Cladorrhinum samala]|uniref:Heterokaryon incompatibility domain-containing protein n=1 Tax=Cladorrhinum samala TaxID=585594 RepID=A0AAV9I5Q2_9PEZI|nr:hypothetical protein QBC42DRAFT_258280 [Cladorrhinum samala]
MSIQFLVIQPSSSSNQSSEEIKLSTETLNSSPADAAANSRSKSEYDILLPFFDPSTGGEKGSQILLDGQALPVEAGLAAALKHLRLQDKPRKVWAYSICQKSELRAAMSGMAAGGAVTADKGKFGLKRKKDPSRGKVYLYLPKRAAEDENGGMTVQAALAALIPDRKLIAIKEQGEELDWNTLERSWGHGLEGFLNVPTEGAKEIKKKVDEIGRLRKQAEKNPDKTRERVWEVLDLLRGLQCQDSRDRLYWVAPWSLEVNYDRSAEQEYFDFARKSVITTGTLDVLNWVRGAESQESSPSWIPQWHKPVDDGIDSGVPVPLLGEWPDGSYRSYRTWGTWMKVQCKDVAEEDYGASPGTTILTGIRFEEVEELGASWHPKSKTEERSSILSQWTELALKSIPEHIKCPYGGLKGRREILEKIFTGAVNAPEQRTKPSLFPTTKPLYLRESSSKSANLLSSPDVYHACANRRLITTKRGYLGLAPAHAQRGDIIVALYGGKTPYLLRPWVDPGFSGPDSARKAEYKLVGELYVAGIMEGEAMSWQHATASMRDFRIV